MKKLVSLMACGFAFGVTANCLFSFATSYLLQMGYYASCLVSLMEPLGGELNAALFQTCVCGAAGAVIAAAPILWKRFAPDVRLCYTVRTSHVRTGGPENGHVAHAGH